MPESFHGHLVVESAALAAILGVSSVDPVPVCLTLPRGGTDNELVPKRLIRTPYTNDYYICSCAAVTKDECTCIRKGKGVNDSSGVVHSLNAD
jgi:hypothetical protein